MLRSSGILMPIFSLASEGGIGTFGKEAYRFVDFLKAAKQSYWQILPLTPTGHGDSPYSSFSAFAGNPYFIDLEVLIDEKLLTKKEFSTADFGNDPHKVDYEKIGSNRLQLLRLAFNRFKSDSEYDRFLEENGYWLNDFACFMAIKTANSQADWHNWPQTLRRRDPAALIEIEKDLKEDIDFYKFLQFKFSQQWFKLKEYANQNGIKIIGDIPIYVALDSCDVWANTEQFQLDEGFMPTSVAGCPPDAFAEDGQLWGNPLYDWKTMKADDYKWWVSRMKHALKLYDVVRIDHFRGFESYFSIPATDNTAKNGKWVKGPDMALFRQFKKDIGDNLPIIAEDLGYLTPQVKKLLKSTGYPGMKVLQFAFDGDSNNDYLPYNHPKNSVVYTGTHDNDTIIGWTMSASDSEVKRAEKFFNAKRNDGFNWTMMRAALASRSDTCILMMPDILALDSNGRINTPSVVGGNWNWRIDSYCINDWLSKIIADLTTLYGRNP
ncbi:MAG: 4-alpha-glucanotransferase [Ruminococcaceae bacterium]|nr:4-alpha-glucanotransferase [Oscillospiraceae bacterium]